MKVNERNLVHFVNCDTPVDREGWLLKRGEVNKSYQKRWFVLKGNLLFYFEKKGDKEPVGLIILEGCTIELAENDDQFTFKIVFHGAGNRTYMLCADNQENMEGWMKALACASYDYMKLMVAELERQLQEINEQQKKLEVQEQLPRSRSSDNLEERTRDGTKNKRINPFSWFQDEPSSARPHGKPECGDGINHANEEECQASGPELEVFAQHQFLELHEYYGSQMRKYFAEQRARALNNLLLLE